MSALGIYLPTELCLEIDAWRIRYDPYQKLWEPHITIAYTPFVPPAEWPVVRPEVAQLLTRFEPFPIKLTGVDFFKNSPNVLWLKPEDDGTLARIRQALEDLLPRYVSELAFGYVPHLTIGFFPKMEDLYEAKKKVEAEFVPVEFEVREIQYMAEAEEGKDRIEDWLPLGKSD